MTSQREAFEKYISSEIKKSDNDKDVIRFYATYKDIIFRGWKAMQAAQADQAATIAQLQLDNARMREALLAIEAGTVHLGKLQEYCRESLATQPTDWDEDRIDVIGQNGNTGEHY